MRLDSVNGVAMTSETTGSFWKAERLTAIEMLSLQKSAGSFDAESARRERRCLGTALGLENDAIVLVLVGLEHDSRLCFATAKQMAVLAYASNESYVYEDPDGLNSMGRYMAMRVAALSEFALSGTDRPHLLSTAVGHLEAVLGGFRGGPVSAPDSRPDAVLVAHLALHYAQLGRWSALSSLGATPLRISTPASRVWSEALRVMVGVAEARCLSSSIVRGPAATALESWFRRSTSVVRYRRPVHPVLLGHFMVGMAEIRAKCCLDLHSPMAIISTLRQEHPLTSDG